MNATLRISVFAQTKKSSNQTLTGVELIICGIDPAIVPAELTDCTVMWHNAISVSHDGDDRTLTIEKSVDDTCENFDALVGREIAAQRKQLAATNSVNTNTFVREVELNVPNGTVDAIIARASGYIDDTLTDQSDDDALGKLLGLTLTDFGAANLFTEGFPLDVIDPQGVAQLV